VFGNVGAGQKDINPLVATDRVDAVVKSYRLDRMNKATQLVGSTQLPYQNNLVKINYLPEGEPIMDTDGEPKDLRYTPSYESVNQVRMPEQARQMPEDYRGAHTAPGPEGAPASDLTGGGVYPSDVYNRPDWYEQDEGLQEIRKIARLRGKPEAPVWIHRSVPVDVAEKAMKSDHPLGYVFRSGDWVTTNRQYAKDHGESVFKGKYELFSKRVKAKDIHTNGDSIFEWGYNPEALKSSDNQ